MQTNSKKALVLGLGASGYTAAKFLSEHGWSVKICDTRKEPGLLTKARENIANFQFFGECMDKEILEDESLVVISPGLSPYYSQASSIVNEAQSRGIEVVGEIELFARELQRLKAERNYVPKIIGITGTNGKTTTTMLTSAIIKTAGKTICTAGNVGPNALGELDRLTKEDKLPEYWVLELSSFQLETTQSLRCDVATLLNVTEDHVDWHGSMDAYNRAKARIFTEGTVRVLNREDSVCMQYADPNVSVMTFGIDEPKKINQFGLKKVAEEFWLSGNLNKQFSREGCCEWLSILPQNKLKIRGRHNVMNALASVALCLSCGVDLVDVIEALTVYGGEPHRVQTVLKTQDLEFVDDSKGTNVGATVAALSGFDQQKIVLILGGDGKGQDFSPLVNPVKEHARAVVLIGQEAPQLETLLKECNLPLCRASSMREAVKLCVEEAQKGDVVLLSPACASWDMFKNYVERSELFLKAAQELTR